VVKHYQAQFAALADHGDEELAAAINLFAADEASHRDEAAADDSKRSLILRAWCWIVGFGSEQAVKIARVL
jgi:ubiquinone biosynthesis monooxygenase Coq7